MIQSEKQKEEKLKKKTSKNKPGSEKLIEWYQKVIKLAIHKTGVPKERISAENIFEEIVPENFPNLVKEMFIDPRNSANPTRINLKKTMPIYIITELLKTEDKILKATRDNYTLHTGEQFKWLQISHQKQWRPEESKITFLKYWNKDTVQTKTLSSKHFLQGWR